MKKLIMIIAAGLFFFESFSQQVNPAPSLSKQDYLAKSKKQKTWAWVLLGTGTAMVVTGTIIAVSETEEFLYEGGGEGAEGGAVLIGTGVAVMAGSIPLFIASGKNKRKAAALSLDFQKVRQVQNFAFVSKSLPSLTLKFNL
jgi:hypothetical protein